MFGFVYKLFGANSTPSVSPPKKDISHLKSTYGNKVIVQYNGNLFDITTYLDHHPGGSEIISENAYTDITEKFKEFGHSKKAEQILLSYKL